MSDTPLIRCHWAQSNEIFFPYHDQEWGVPRHDDHILFEMLNLEGAQAGLSWLTILKRREGYRNAFDNFDASKIAEYDSAKKELLLKNPEIIRNHLKIDAVIENAKAYLEILEEETFDTFIWQFSGGKVLREEKASAIQASKEMSKTLKKRGFRFVGETICYAFMQAIGMVNDHEVACFRYKEV